MLIVPRVQCKMLIELVYLVFESLEYYFWWKNRPLVYSLSISRDSLFIESHLNLNKEVLVSEPFSEDFWLKWKTSKLVSLASSDPKVLHFIVGSFDWKLSLHWSSSLSLSFSLLLFTIQYPKVLWIQNQTIIRTKIGIHWISSGSSGQTLRPTKVLSSLSYVCKDQFSVWTPHQIKCLSVSFERMIVHLIDRIEGKDIGWKKLRTKSMTSPSLWSLLKWTVVDIIVLKAIYRQNKSQMTERPKSHFVGKSYAPIEYRF